MLDVAEVVVETIRLEKDKNRFAQKLHMVREQAIIEAGGDISQLGWRHDLRTFSDGILTFQAILRSVGYLSYLCILEYYRHSLYSCESVSIFS